MILLAVVAAVIWGLWAAFSVSVIDVGASKEIDAAKIESETRQLVAASWSRQSLLVADTGELETALLAKDPAVASAQITKSWPHTLNVRVVPKVPTLIWISGSDQYVLDGEGTVIGRPDPGVKLPTVVDDNNLPIKVGDKPVGLDFVTFVADFNAGLSKASGIVATSFELKESVSELYVKTGSGFELILDTSRGAGDELQDLSVLMGYLNKQHKKPTQYIDLRVPERAYYK